MDLLIDAQYREPENANIRGCSRQSRQLALVVERAGSEVCLDNKAGSKALVITKVVIKAHVNEKADSTTGVAENARSNDRIAERPVAKPR